MRIQGVALLMLLALLAVLLLGGYERIRSGQKAPRRPFFEDLDRTTSLALAGAMLLALALLVDVYGADWTTRAIGDDLRLAFAGSGGVLVLISLVLDYRSRNRRS